MQPRCGSRCCRARNYDSASAEFTAHARMLQNSKMGPTLESGVEGGGGEAFLVVSSIGCDRSCASAKSAA